MKILHICSIDNDMANGVTVIVPQYARNQAEENDITLYNVNKKEYTKNEKFVVYNKKNMIDDILKQKEVDIAVFHGIYFFPYLHIYKKLLEKGIPYVIVPHCSLTEEAQKQKRIIKKIVNFLYFNRFVQKAATIQYLSETEKKASCKFINNSIIIPNGIMVEDECWKSRKKDTFDLVFIGRYAIFQKGLDRLVGACELIKDEMLHKKIMVQLYGSDFENNKEQLKKMISEKGLTDIVCVNDSVYNEEKKEKFLNADCFILTSRFEGQPVAVLEALSVGLVPIITEGTTFANIIRQNNCGFYAKDDEHSIAEAIIKAYDSKTELENMSKNAIQVVKSNYEWSGIVKRTIKEYKKILDT